MFNFVIINHLSRSTAYTFCLIHKGMDHCAQLSHFFWPRLRQLQLLRMDQTTLRLWGPELAALVALAAAALRRHTAQCLLPSGSSFLQTIQTILFCIPLMDRADRIHET